ncbi:uncharacterized protein LOC131681184 [Topomyia yanbarensis]|uniref:uncharacterized protein LOC131681184 n=1 Tax=Topomyia yanbarensis TaxID=2498891 RepID=UPI00273B2A57|nr:uncharacterized protein LOC131681184 [Topomyia yanbarensis]
MPPVIVADFKQTINWITHNQDEWDEVKHKWKNTSAQRIYELLKLKNRTASLLLSEYPVFRNHQGYQLIQIDFQLQFPDKEKLLFDRWSSFLKGIRHILQVEVSDTEGKALLELLKADDISVDGQSLITVWLLAHVLPSPLLICSGKRRWKPSILESRDSIVVLVKDLSELQATIAKLFSSWRDYDIASTPFIVVHGEDLKHPTGFTVWNNVVSYKLPSFQKALDICLKLYKSYSLDFPRQTASVWHLLACYLYDFTLPSEQTNITAMVTAIRAKASS